MRKWLGAFLALMIGAGSVYAASTINSEDPVTFPLSDSGNPTTATQNLWIANGAGTFRITPQQAGYIFQGSSAPASPFRYQFWWDTSLTPPALKVYSGSTWLTVGNDDFTNALWSAPIGGGSAPSINSGATTDLCPSAVPTVAVTGVASISSFGSTCQQGTIKVVKFTGAATLVYNATSMILPGGINITTAAGDIALFEALGSGNWRMDGYLAASGLPITTASPAFTGVPTAPTAAPGTNTTQLATTAFVAGSFAPLASPALTGDPTAPTAALTDGDTSIATTAFVQNLNQPAPQGRLTLTSGTPVMTADTTSSVIFYTPYVGNKVPIYTGSGYISYTFSELSLALTIGGQSANSPYDVFVFSNAGVPAICAGPAWTNVTTRSAATAITRGTNGIWSNALGFSGACLNGATGYTIPANRATYVGSFYATSNGSTQMVMNPAAASGGTNNFLALYNAYNRVPVGAIAQDSDATWTYNSGTYAALNASNSNRINFIDGLAQSLIKAKLTFTASTVGNYAVGAVNLDSTSATPALVAKAASASPTTASAEAYFNPVLGVHYVQAIQQTGGGTGTYTGSPSEGLQIEIGM